MTAKETDEIRELVESAVGIDASRGDTVNIKGFQFSAPPKDAEADLAQSAKSAQQQNFYLQIASLSAMVILAIIALFIFYNLFKRPADGEIVEDYDNYGGHFPQLGNDGDEAYALGGAGAAAMLGGGGGDTNYPALEASTDPELEMMRTTLSTMINDNPAEAARVLLSYMKDT